MAKNKKQKQKKQIRVRSKNQENEKVVPIEFKITTLTDIGTGKINISFGGWIIKGNGSLEELQTLINTLQKKGTENGTNGKQEEIK